MASESLRADSSMGTFLVSLFEESNLMLSFSALVVGALRHATVGEGGRAHLFHSATTY